MKEFKYTYNLTSDFSDEFCAYFDTDGMCVFDIETTGFSAATGNGKIIMTAMLIRKGDSVEVTQYLAENHYEERDVVKSTLDFFKKNNVSYLVTYNGAAFDIPFMRVRIDRLKITERFSYYNLDLFKFIRLNSNLKQITGSLSQKSVEAYLGIGLDRDDVITGRDSVILYNEYAVSHDERLERVILTHNMEDVLQLYRILCVLFSSYDSAIHRESPLFSAETCLTDIHEALAKYGIPSVNCSYTIKPKIVKKELKITGAQLKNPCDWISFSAPPVNTGASFKSEPEAYEIRTELDAYGSSLYADLGRYNFDKSLLDRLHIEQLDEYVNGSVILVDNGRKNHAEINTFSQLLLTHYIGRVSL